MNEEVEEVEQSQQRRHRHHARSQFLRKFDRYRVLVLEKWWLLSLGTVLGAGIGWAINHFGAPSFTSVSRMIVSIKLAIPEGSVYSEEMSAFLGTQTALMKSETVMNRARARVADLATNSSPQPTMNVNVLPKTSIFVLQATGEDPHYTEAFLQACMEEYIQVKHQMRTQTSDATAANLGEEAVRLEGELRKCDTNMADFQNSNDVVTFEAQQNSEAAYLTSLQQKLADQKSEYELLQMLTLDQNLARQQAAGSTPAPPAGARSNDGSAPAKAAPDSSAPGNPGPGNSAANNSALTSGDTLADQYFRAKQELLLMKADQQNLARYLRPNHPKMIAMGEELARREHLLEIYRQQGGEQLDSRKATLALQIENTEQNLKEETAKALNMSRKAAEYAKLKENAERTRAVYERLLSTMQTLDVNKEVSPESVSIMEKASPAYPDRPNLSKQMLTGTIIGLLVGIGLLMLVDKLDDRMHSYSELQELFDEEVLGQIPREKSGGRRKDLRLLGPEDERHSFVESYRNLRSSFVYMATSGVKPRTLLVTSSVPNDGKSMTSANFAITLAHAGSRVLLVDADLRKGTQHHRFEVNSEPGLCEVLADGQTWDAAVITTQTPNLFLLPRGRSTHDSSELFLRDRIVKLLKEAAAKFDYVIIDTAPVMAADDVSSLAPHVDGVLFVIRAEQTSARVARAALDLLYQRQINVLGVVFNAVRPSSSDYYYYYKYEDYYRSYPTGKDKSKKREPKTE